MILRENLKALVTFLNQETVNINEFYNTTSISSQCVSGSAIKIGAVCSSVLTTSFKISSANTYNVIGAVISLQIFKNSTWQNAGVYTVTKANRYRDIITVTASDNMILFNENAFTADENGMKINQISQYLLSSERCIYDVLNYVVSLAGLELGNSQEEIEKMPNGTKTTMLYIDNENAYLRDWLSWCAEFLGGFAYADENGKIRIKQFEKEPSAIITNSEIAIDTAEIADFCIKNFDVSITCDDNRWYKTYTVLDENESKNTVVYIDFSDNPLAQGYAALVKQRYSDDIQAGKTDSERTEKMYEFTSSVWESLNYNFIPFQATVHVDKLLETAQCIQIQDAEGKNYNVTITHHTWTLNGGQQIKCVGEDTRLLSDYRNRTALKRESEKLQSKINEAKGKDVTQSELDKLAADGKLVEGMTYYVI